MFGHVSCGLWRQSASATEISKSSQPTGQADLLSEHGGVQVGDVTRVPAERTLGVQREGDGNRDIDGARVLQQEGHLGARTGLAAGHHHALRRGRLVQAMFYRLILWHAEVQLVEAQQEGVPVLQGENVITGFYFLNSERQRSLDISSGDKVTLKVNH